MSSNKPGSTLRYRFHTREFGDLDIHYRTLRDRNQFGDEDQAAEKLGVSPASWPMFGMLWQAGEVLALYMADFELSGQRILEVGCGVGLASLVLNKRGADISATDYHPSAEAHLDYNSALNGDRKIPFLRSAWQDRAEESFGSFDVIIASDVMFEPDHAGQLVAFLQSYARPNCQIILADAGRGYRNAFIRSLTALGFSHEELPPLKPFTDAGNYKGKLLSFRR
jgi:predicted nicotinamide N-methyase